MHAPRPGKEITLSNLLKRAKRKLVEQSLLEEMLEMTEQELATIIARSQTQRQLIHLHAAELNDVIDSLQLFADSVPVVH